MAEDLKCLCYSGSFKSIGQHSEEIMNCLDSLYLVAFLRKFELEIGLTLLWKYIQRAKGINK